MPDPIFYKNHGPFSLSDISEHFKCKIVGNSKKLIHDISSLSEATNSDISFLSNKKYVDQFNQSKAGVIIVEKKFVDNKNSREYVVSNNPYFLFAQIVQKFYPTSIVQNNSYFEEDFKKESKTNKFSYRSFVHKTAKIGHNTQIGVNTFIGPGVEIGENCNISDNVSIFFSKIKNSCTIFSGSRIGGEGFGFAIEGNKFLKIPQVGRVIIHDGVQVGCNVTIDRGSAGDTVIKRNCMIDNLVQIGHNVSIGENCVIAAMVGISGSTKIGNNVLIGGKVGFSGHLNIGNNVKIAAGSGVIKDIKDNESVGGYPAQSIFDWHRSTINLKKLKKDV